MKMLNAARNRGVTLIEAVLFIVIALALMIGGIIFFQQASLSARINDAIRTVVSVQSETRGMYQSSSTFGTASSITPALIAAGAVPAKLANGNVLNNEFGGTITVTGNGATFDVAYTNLPGEACVRLTPFSANGQGIAGVGIESVAIGGAAAASSLSPAEAATACAAFDGTVTWTFSR